MTDMKTKQPQLTDRDLDLFTDLYTHGLLNTKQIAAIHSKTETHRRRLQRRLQILRENNLIHYLETPVDEPRDYVLAQRGMNALSNARSFAPKRMSIPRSARSYRNHDRALSDFTVTIDLHVRSLERANLIDEISLINRSPRLDVRSHRGWPVTFSHEGETLEHWVKPDRFMGIKFHDRLEHQNARYFAIEIDRGTMPLQANNLHKASIFRKLLTYQSTYIQSVLQELFVIPHAYTLFLTPGSGRRDNMVKLAQSIVSDDKAAKAMLFAVQPSSPLVGSHTNLASISWINGRGEEMTFPL